MANRDIIARMIAVLDDYEAGKIRPEDVERSMQFNMEALEALPYKRIKEAQHLCYRLVTAHMFIGEEEFVGKEDVATILADFREFFASLPSSSMIVEAPAARAAKPEIFVRFRRPMAKAYNWKREHARLWDALVPKSGRASTLQGELIRIAGKLTDEAYRNGNLNWDSDCASMWRFVGEHLEDSRAFTNEQSIEIHDAIAIIIRDHDCPDLREEGSPYYLVSERVVDWCIAHPDPLPLPDFPKFKR